MTANIFDTLGQPLVSCKLKQGCNKIDIHTEYGGMYTIILADNNDTTVYTQRFAVKEKS